LLDAIGPERIANDILQWASDRMAAINAEWNDAAFLNFLQNHPNTLKSGKYMATLVATLILIGQEDTAKALCHQARTCGQSGGYLVGSKSFMELAIEWIATQHRRRTLH